MHCANDLLIIAIFVTLLTTGIRYIPELAMVYNNTLAIFPSWHHYILFDNKNHVEAGIYVTVTSKLFIPLSCLNSHRIATSPYSNSLIIRQTRTLMVYLWPHHYIAIYNIMYIAKTAEFKETMFFHFVSTQLYQWWQTIHYHHTFMVEVAVSTKTLHVSM